MKKSIRIYAVLFAAMSLVVSCTKDENESMANLNSLITEVPDSFTQKVLLEVFTGASQAQCPDGFVKLEDVLHAYPDNCIPVNIHFSDAMEITQYTVLESLFSNGMPMSYPSGMVNRRSSAGNTILNRTQWMSNTSLAASQTASCGLAIQTSVNGSIGTIEVKTGFAEAVSGVCNLTVYLVENAVSGTGTGWDQRNAYHTTSGHTYQGAGDPITNFAHQYVVRKSVTLPLGEPILGSTMIKGGIDTKFYSVDLSPYKFNDLSVVAFVSKTGTSGSDLQILNVQKVKMGQDQNWD